MDTDEVSDIYLLDDRTLLLQLPELTVLSFRFLLALCRFFPLDTTVSPRLVYFVMMLPVGDSLC